MMPQNDIYDSVTFSAEAIRSGKIVDSHQARNHGVRKPSPTLESLQVRVELRKLGPNQHARPCRVSPGVIPFRWLDRSTYVTNF